MANGTPNLDLAMRIAADMGDAIKDAQQLEAALDQVEAAGKKGAKGVDATATSANAAAAATTKATTATKANSAALKQQAAAADKAARSNATAANSAKQNALAMRQLPAQITDIVTGLASGQNPMMVLIQQGGQLKDSFGGVVPAARALLGAISPLAIVLTAAGGAVALVAAGMVKGYKEIRAYDNALISTGNVAGETSGRLADMADQVGAATGEYGDADAAMLQLAQSGKIAGDSLDEAASAAVNLAKLTGDSIEATTDKIIELADAPSKMLLKLNEQYHFLTVEVLEHVKALEDQGRAEDAARMAVEEFARIHEQRVKEAEARAGYLETVWRNVGDAIAGAWNDIKSIGRQDVQHELEIARMQLESIRRNRGLDVIPPSPGQLKLEAEAEARVKALEAQAAAEQAVAKAKADAQRVEDHGAKARGEIVDGLERARSKTEQLSAATKKLADNYRKLHAANPGDALLSGVVFGADGSVSGGSFDKQLKALQEQFKERTPKTPRTKLTDAQRDEAAAQRALQTLKQQITLLGELEEGETRASEAARIRFETTQGDYRNASAATKQQLLDQAQLLDTERLRVESAKKMVEVQLEIARLQGRGDDGQLAKVRENLGRLQADLEKLGKTKDAADVAKLLNLHEASADLKNLRQVYDQAMGEIALEQQRIQVELQAGLLTEGEAQQRIVDLYKEKLVTLKELVPQMRAAAKALGDPEAVAAVEQIAMKLQQMEATTNLLQQAVRSTFQESFKQALLSLVDGTASLTEAVRQFFVSMAEGMAEFAAEQLSQKAASALMARFGDLFGTVANAASDATGAAATSAAAAQLSAAGATVAAGGTSVATSATALASSSTALTSAGGAVLAGAAAVTTAAAQLQAAATTMLAANAASSVGGFAEGGFTGYGGKYQVAGLVHKGEGVLSAAEIRALGGPRGFYALRDAIRNGFADGGLVTTSEPSVRLSGPSAMHPSVNNKMRVYLLQNEDQLAQRLAQHPAMEKAVVAIAGQNGNSIRAEW